MLQALKLLRHSGLMPYVVFIASPRMERLQCTRKITQDKQKRRLASFSSTESDQDEPQLYTVRIIRLQYSRASEL